MAKLIKNIVILLLVVIVFAVTLFIESGIEPEEIRTYAKEVILVPVQGTVSLVREGESAVLDAERQLKPGDEITTNAGEISYIEFDDNGVIRLEESSSMDFTSEFENGYVFTLNKGRAWVNNLYTSSYLNVQAGAALLMPRRSAFDVEYDEVVTNVRAFKNHVNVGLISPDYVPERILQYKNDVLINSFLVAQGGQASVHLSKVVQNISVLRQLLYSKLIKEFQYSLMDMRSLLGSDSWIRKNLEDDDALYEKVVLQKINDVNSRGLKFSSLEALGYRADQFFTDAADILTFSDEKRVTRLMNSFFDQLLDAEYLLIYGRLNEAKERLNLFTANIDSEVFRQQQFRALLLDKLRWHYANLNHVLPTDDLYDAKLAVYDLLKVNLGDNDREIVERLELIRDFLNYAYSLVETDVLQAKLSLEVYFNEISEFIDNYGAFLENVKYMLSEDNQIMDSLLRQYSQLYQDNIFAIKSYLESEWLNLLPDGTAKTEEQQTIISTKIDFLKQLQTFFLDQKVTLDDTRDIVLRLINEIQDLQPAAQVGVSELFALRLEDYGNFLRFLNTTDVASLRGVSPRVRYEEFLARQEEQVSVEEVLSEFFGEERLQPAVTLTSILNQAAADFEAVGATEVEFGQFVSTDQKYINVDRGVFQDIVFSARYDWDNKQISMVKVGTEVVSQNPIRLSNLPLLLGRKSEEETAAAEEQAEPVGEAAQPELTKAEKAAKILLEKKLQADDIEVQEENIVIYNFDTQTYIINGAVLVSAKNIQLAFVYNNRDDIANSLVVRTPSGDVKVPGDFNLDAVSGASKSAYDEAAAEE